MTLKTTAQERQRLRAYYAGRANNPAIGDMADDIDTLLARVAELEEQAEQLREALVALISEEHLEDGVQIWESPLTFAEGWESACARMADREQAGRAALAATAPTGEAAP